MDINSFLITAYLICCGLSMIVCCFSLCYMMVVLYKYIKDHKDDGLYIEEPNAIGFIQEDEDGC